MKAFIKENLYLIALWILCIVGIAVFCGHYANILLDVGREVYYPERILNGKVLYKDLFNIYGPLSYLCNALLYKLFGIKLSTLYLSGAVCSIGIVTAVYLIAKRFLAPILSFSVGVFTIATGICATHLFNYTFPYSWAMLYGTLLSMFSLLSLLMFKENNKPHYLYLSAFLSGCAVACKYEFFLFSLIILTIAFCTKNLKVILKALTAFIAAPIVSFGILFAQGLQIPDLIKNVQDINTMMHTSSLHYFYKHSGVLFSIPILIYWVVNFIKAGLGFALILGGIYYYPKNKEACFFLTLIGAIITFKLANPAIFAFLIGATIILAICRFKDIKSSSKLFILILSAAALSLKSLWGLTPLNYGNYYCSLVLIAFFSLLFTMLDKKYEKAAAIFVLVTSLWFLLFNIKPLKLLNTRILSPRGKIYTSKEFADPINSTINYLNNNNTEKTIVFPEGLILNFLSNTSRISDDYYNSLIPLYIETFGDEKLIKHFKQNPPDYIIFNNQKMEDYNTGYICRDYANDFCGYVMQNYSPAASFGSEFGFFIYKKPAK